MLVAIVAPRTTVMVINFGNEVVIVFTTSSLRNNSRFPGRNLTLTVDASTEQDNNSSKSFANY